MSEPVTVLLLGGPKDGELIAVQNPMDGLRVIEFADDYESLYRWGSEDPVATVETRTRYYAVQRVAMFGRILVVLAIEGMSTEEQAERAFEHLASDKAKAVVLR